MSMMTSDAVQAASSLRFRTAIPHPDEALSSALDRAASLWGVTRHEVLCQLGQPKSSCDEFDGSFSEALLRSMAHAFSMDYEDLASRSAFKGRLDVLMAPCLRHAYCPLCFEDDWKSGRTPYFRLDWARFFMTHCQVHDTPLFEWMAVRGYGGRHLPHEFHLPYDPSASLPTWVADNLRKARAWLPSALGDKDAYALWRALIQVEGAWHLAGIGDPRKYSEDVVIRHEYLLFDVAPLFVTVPCGGGSCLAEMLRTPTHQFHVFGYNRIRQGRYVNGSFKKICWRLPSIQARRNVLILVAHTLGELGVDLRFETGSRIPPGDSREWHRCIMDYHYKFKNAQQSLCALKRWLRRNSLDS